MTAPTLDSLLAYARSAVKTKAKVQAVAAIRKQEVSNLSWPVDNREHWTPVGIRLIFELQRCDICDEERLVFHQELVGFRSLSQPTTIKWKRGRGESMEGDLPTSREVIERDIPICWDCHCLHRHLNNLWSILKRSPKCPPPTTSKFAIQRVDSSHLLSAPPPHWLAGQPSSDFELSSQAPNSPSSKMTSQIPHLGDPSPRICLSSSHSG